MKFTFVSLFPNLIEPYFQDSILKRAVEAKHIEYEFYNPRDYTENKHNKVDKQMIGGGAGMLLTPQPLFDCLDAIKSKKIKRHISFFHSQLLKLLSKMMLKDSHIKKNIVFVSGRYEGIDERVIEKYADEVFFALVNIS